jgi:hypothetical protein
MVFSDFFMCFADVVVVNCDYLSVHCIASR